MAAPKPMSRSGGRSYIAMCLSAILPGIGQFYLGQFAKGAVLFFVFISASGLFYINSLPVAEWRDLLRFEPAPVGGTSELDSEKEEGTDYAIHLWTFDDGEKLMFRPSWKLKISALIQAGLCWLYAVIDGWRGRRASVSVRH